MKEDDVEQFWAIWNSRVEWRAYERMRRLGRHILTREDYEAAYLGQLLDTGYEKIKGLRLVGRPSKLPAVWQEPPKCCRYCMKSEAGTSFRNKSHAVPEFIGNTALISDDECDKCNTQFSQSFEDHFDKFTLPMRAFFGVRGKDKCPKYKPNAHDDRISLKRSGDNIEIKETNEHRVVLHEQDSSFSVELRCQPLVPLEVYRCFVKMALAIMPCDDLRYFDVARRWVVCDQLDLRMVERSWAWCYIGFIPERDPEPMIWLWRRKFSPFPVPFYVAGFSFRCFVFMYAVPGCLNDRHFRGTQMMLPRFDFADSERLEHGVWRTFRLDNGQVDGSVKFALGCTRDSV